MRDGILVLNKAQGMTSHDVVQLARQRLSTRRIGHAGTLDPMARGVLLLLVGGAVKHQQAFQAHRKRYEAVIRLGTKTDTGDAWGRPIHTAPVPSFDHAKVEGILASCVGQMSQVPPHFSAVKVCGRPLYWWARHGTPLTAKARTVEIFAIELVDLESCGFRCRMECSTGTYIRSLAETIAQRLGTVGHVSELVRLSVGSWNLDQASGVEWLKTTSADEIWAALQPVGPVPIFTRQRAHGRAA